MKKKRIHVCEAKRRERKANTIWPPADSMTLTCSTYNRQFKARTHQHQPFQEIMMVFLIKKRRTTRFLRVLLDSLLSDSCSFVAWQCLKLKYGFDISLSVYYECLTSIYILTPPCQSVTFHQIVKVLKMYICDGAMFLQFEHYLFHVLELPSRHMTSE